MTVGGGWVGCEVHVRRPCLGHERSHDGIVAERVAPLDGGDLIEGFVEVLRARSLARPSTRSTGLVFARVLSQGASPRCVLMHAVCIFFFSAPGQWLASSTRLTHGLKGARFQTSL